jgi:acetate kinase
MAGIIQNRSRVSILVANIGSTSFKFRLFDPSASTVLAHGRVERIGQPGSDCPDYDTAIRRCTDELTRPGGPLHQLSDLAAIGFKAVHAGPVGGARLVDDQVLAAMEEFSFLAPAHNPPYIAAMRSFRRTLPGTPLVALFETAFFDELDEAATTYAVPYAWRQELGVRRYGFHGASHRAAGERARALLARERVRHVSCHLGGSSSIAGIRDGVAVETSFGFSPQSGVPHNDRVGDMDVFAALFVMKRRGLDPDAMASVLATQSGLAGVSGISGDVRDLEDAAARGDRRARLAIDVFVRAVRHHVGACLVVLGGIDVLTFSGGIGEHSASVRAAVCAGLEEFGIVLDPAANAAARGDACISAGSSRVPIHIVPADEERIVARATLGVLASAHAATGGPHGI